MMNGVRLGNDGDSSCEGQRVLVINGESDATVHWESTEQVGDAAFERLRALPAALRLRFHSL